MKVQIERAFPLPAGAGVAWQHLQNIEEVAACMPGAAITERLDGRHFKGTVAVRFGPAAMTFRGDVEVREIDPDARMLRLYGKGTDSTGTSGAAMDLTARIESVEAGGSRLVGASEVSMSGKAAAFGGRMMSAVADQVLKQFADNFAAVVKTPVTPSPGSGPESGSGSGAKPGTAAGNGAFAVAVESKPAHELNGVALIWSVIRAWLRALFGKTPA